MTGIIALLDYNKVNLSFLLIYFKYISLVSNEVVTVTFVVVLNDQTYQMVN